MSKKLILLFLSFAILSAPIQSLAMQKSAVSTALSLLKDNESKIALSLLALASYKMYQKRVAIKEYLKVKKNHLVNNPDKFLLLLYISFVVFAVLPCLNTAIDPLISIFIMFSVICMFAIGNKQENFQREIDVALVQNDYKKMEELVNKSKVFFASRVNNDHRFNGDHPLVFAASMNRFEITKLFLEHCYDITKKDIDKAFKEANNEYIVAPPSSNYNVERKHYHLKLLKMLLKKGANINTQDGHGNTPLHNAVIRNSIRLVSLLLIMGADTTIKNNNGQSFYDLIKDKPQMLALARKIQNKISNAIDKNSPFPEELCDAISQLVISGDNEPIWL